MSRALHPREAELLRHLRPALVRAKGARARVEERADARRAAERMGDEVVLRHTVRAHELSEAVQAAADTDVVDALLEYFGIGGADADMATVLECSLAVIDGGKGKRS